MTEQEERFWFGGTKEEIEEAYQEAKNDLREGLYNAKDKLAYLRNEAIKQGFVFSNNPYKALPDIQELCKFFEIEEYELDSESLRIERMASPEGL